MGLCSAGSASAFQDAEKVMNSCATKYELWAWAPLSKRWYREGASAEGAAGLVILRRLVELAADGVRLEIRTEAGQVVE